MPSSGSESQGTHITGSTQRGYTAAAAVTQHYNIIILAEEKRGKKRCKKIGKEERVKDSMVRRGRGKKSAKGKKRRV
ncbi:unnamed protein product [Pleuronectes platessa]|uniref:Uncharacterized protein n=1 Tax=Pleuronectes platessa TaxID=8262 RepID=A0A9N7Z846_PLEPL|nr:unnamed protein product [Pleuronectes platessa]